jgi:hypothetical protein
LRTYSTYTLGSGEEIGVAYPLLRIVVLKYNAQESAEEAYNNFSEILHLEDLIFSGVKIRGIETENDYPGPTYMLHSNEFIIFVDGNLQVCRDAASRIIDLYSINISNP